jgi:hypothetical protein
VLGGSEEFARRELLQLFGQRLHLPFEFANSLLITPDQCFDEILGRFGFGRQFDAWWRLAHAAIEPDNMRSSPDEFSHFLAPGRERLPAFQTRKSPG